MTREELFEKNKNILYKYIPEKSVERVAQLIFEYNFKLRIKADRKNKWGDFKYNHISSQVPIITINKSLNPYSFLITLIHEIAHCKTYKEYGNTRDPHGYEWKKNFQLLMQEFLNTDVFPVDILYVLRQHMQNPSASANADLKLYKVLMNYNQPSAQKHFIEYIKDGEKFLYEGQVYQRINRIRKKIECVQLSSGKRYLFSPVTEIEIFCEEK